MKNIFSVDFKTSKTSEVRKPVPISDYAGIISTRISPEATRRGEEFAEEIEKNFYSDFEKSEELFNAGKTDGIDKMVHVSTFCVIDGYVYMTYYANTKGDAEDPKYQTARLVYCPVDRPEEKTFLDIQTVGDECSGLTVDLLYDTIFAKKADGNLVILWTAQVGGNYYRLYRPFDTKTKTLGEIGVNRFTVGNITNDFSTTGITSAMAENGLFIKNMFNEKGIMHDIGIMQKFTAREENGKTYYYTGVYSGDFNCIIKSENFIDWIFVAQPEFENMSLWENATYVRGDKIFYFVRQKDASKYGFLTVYDIVKGSWETPVLVEDCQSRSDFIVYRGDLYLFHAPTDREHIGIIKINEENISASEVVLQSHIKTSCFYPFIQYFTDGELAMSYTVSRKHIRLARFTLSKYLDI
ncbi:MAG: hypothetical protein IJS67_00615 [Clostridia bacterium]|nr:hypothetical protein [Clostridia bacterium]